jgi:hypothetical protein
MKRRFAVIFVMTSLLSLTGCQTVVVQNPPVVKSISPSSFAISANFFNSQSFGISPAVWASQGYATDGLDNYLFSTSKIVEADSGWKATYSNDTPFAGITGITVNHLGDGEVSGDLIYAPIAYFSWAGKENFMATPWASAIGVYAAHTAGLPLRSWTDITSSGCDASGIAVGPNNTLYVSSFFINTDKLCLFDATTLASKGELALSIPLPRIQGISYNSAAKQFAVSTDDAEAKIGYIYFVSLTGQVTGPVYTLPQRGELEGLDYTQGYIAYDIGARIHYLYPVQVTGSNFDQDATVQVQGSTQQTIFDNSESLTTIINLSSLDGFGETSVRVANPGFLGGTSSAVKITVREHNHRHY